MDEVGCLEYCITMNLVNYTGHILFGHLNL